MAKGTILVARHELSGGKKGAPISVSPGDQITDAVKKEFGLKAADIAELIDKGAIGEVSVHAETSVDDGASDAAIKAEKKRADDAEALVKTETKRADDAEALVKTETKRADDAEAKVTELTKQLEDATKPAA